MSETVGMTLTEFLLARVAEDEAVARDAAALAETPWRAAYGRQVEAADGYLVTPEDEHSDLGDPADAVSQHIARHDPARALAECEAKRRIVATASGWKHAVVEDCWYTCAAATEEDDGGECCDDGRRGSGCDCGRDFRVKSILAPLALPYADHPDYDESWRP